MTALETRRHRAEVSRACGGGLCSGCHWPSCLTAPASRGQLLLPQGSYQRPYQQHPNSQWPTCACWPCRVSARPSFPQPAWRCSPSSVGRAAPVGLARLASRAFAAPVPRRPHHGASDRIPPQTRPDLITSILPLCILELASSLQCSLV